MIPPLLIAVAGALLAGLVLVVTTALVVLSWRRQDRVLRRMQRELAERTRHGGANTTGGATS